MTDPRTYTGDPQFIDECKQAYVTVPSAIEQVERMTSPAIDLYAMYADSLRRMSAIRDPWQETAHKRLLQLEHRVINDATLAIMNTEGDKPVQIYRLYKKVLHSIAKTSKVYARDAQQVLADIYLTQTQPDGELDTPFWIDSMTGETEPDFVIDTDLKTPDGELVETITVPARMKRTIVISEWQTWCIRRSAEIQTELGWDDKTRWQWVEAQGASSGLGEIEDIDEPEDDRAYVPASLQKDMTDGGTEATPLDKACFIPLAEILRAWHHARTRTFAQMAKAEIHGKANWKATFQQLIRKTDEYESLIQAIQSTADNYGAKEAVAVYLRVAGEYGLMDGDDDSINDIAHIHLNPDRTIAGITDFKEFLTEYEDTISELMADSSVNVQETSERTVDDFVKQTEGIIANRYPTHDPNPLNTASWNLGYQKAISSGAAFADAEVKAWETWRYAMSFFAASAYDRVMKKERNRTKAMAEFWRFAPPSVPRPQDIIVNISRNGMTVKKNESAVQTRLVAWNIAVLKLQKNELKLDKPTASRLLDIMQSKGWDKKFTTVLASKIETS